MPSPMYNKKRTSTTSTADLPFESFRYRRITGTKSASGRIKYPGSVNGSKRLKVKHDMDQGLKPSNMSHSGTFFSPHLQPRIMQQNGTPKTLFRAMSKPRQGQMLPRSLNQTGTTNSIAVPPNSYNQKRKPKQRPGRGQKATGPKRSSKGPAFQDSRVEPEEERQSFDGPHSISGENFLSGNGFFFSPCKTSVLSRVQTMMWEENRISHSSAQMRMAKSPHAPTPSPPYSAKQEEGIVDFSIYSNSVAGLPHSSSAPGFAPHHNCIPRRDQYNRDYLGAPMPSADSSSEDDMESTMLDLFGDED